MPIKAVVALYAGKEVFKHLVADVYKAVSTKTKVKYKQWDTEKKIESLYKKIYKVRKVKTIWQVDKAIDLKTFYCDSHVVINNKRKKIINVSDFKVKDNLGITGIAGQGKSIFLRHLCAEELDAGNYIPVFIELRRVQKGVTLRDRIYIEFQNLGLAVGDILFDALADSGKILILLDAFDEVPDEEKQRVLTEIEDLSSTREQLRIIVTTRPNNNIDKSLQFLVVPLDNLKDKEYQTVIQKLADSTNLASTLINRVETHTAQIKNLLCTPLMVTLLIISYKAYQELPTQLSGFYDSLFQTLLQRHDGSKPGYKRERGCKLDDLQYRRVFETLCIVAKESNESSFSHEDIYRFSKKALEQNDFSENPDKYLNDIVKITCLILRDGEEYRFIHKSVQEYYTAAFIKSKPEPRVIKFYSRLNSEDNYLRFRAWAKELEFLSEIDEYRYNKYFLLPVILNFLKIKEQDLQGKCPKITLAKTKEILGDFKLGIEINNSRISSLQYTFLAEILLYQRNLELHSQLGMHPIFNLNVKTVTKAFKSKIFKPKSVFTVEDSTEILVGVIQLLNKGLMRKEFILIAEDMIKHLFSAAVKIAYSLNKEEKDEILNDLI